MPIRINDSSVDSYNGIVAVTLAGCSGGLVGTSNPAAADNDGAIAQTLAGVTVKFRESTLYPLVATGRGGTPNFGQTDAVQDRKAMGHMDVVHHQGMDSGGHMDPPVLSGYMLRSDAIWEMINAHPTGEVVVCAYHNMMETPSEGLADANEQAREAWVQGVVGPNGTDGFAYNASGVKKSFFTGQHGINITNQVQLKDGMRYPVYYAINEVQVKWIDVMTAAGIPAKNIGVMLDNFQAHANSGSVSWAYDGANNDTQDYYDIEDIRHSAFEVEVSSLTRSGTTATCVTATDHGLNNDGQVLVSGANQSEYNGTFTEPNESNPDSFTIVNDTTFTYPVSGSPASPATGTIVTTAADRFGEPVIDAATLYGEWRENYALGRAEIVSRNPGIFILTNTNQWADDRDPAISTQTWAGAVSGLPTVLPEYRLGGDPTKAVVNGGWAEGNIKSGFPRSGVNPQGTGPEGNGGFQQLYNALYMVTSTAQPPAVVFCSGLVECYTTSVLGAGGKNIYPNVPNPAVTPWNLVRWFFGLSQVVAAHFAPNGIKVGSTAGRAASTPIFEYTGMRNGSIDYGFSDSGPVTTTRLYRKWMGTRVSDPPTTAWNNGLWMAEWTNACIIVNPDNDSTDTPRTVDVSALPGGANEWMEFFGADDPTTHDGSYRNSDYTLDPIDASILVRRSWYEAL
jgi:hypothetical protein